MRKGKKENAIIIISKKNEVNHHPKFQNNVNITKARLKQHRMISQEPVKLSFCKK